uniref:Uncharacterized protein n=1 Tax=Octopus bimaculoides TaxID=37653 RepID=A0A0L8HG66_OCTBM
MEDGSYETSAIGRISIVANNVRQDLYYLRMPLHHPLELLQPCWKIGRTLLNDLNPSGSPPYILVLKKHSSIMLALKNHSSIMLVRNLDPVGEVVNGTHVGIRIMIPRIPLTTKEDYPFTFFRKLFPVKPAFGMISNKSQDQTLEKFGIYLPTPKFSHCQFYVVIITVGSVKNVHVLALDSEYKGRKRIYTDNVVYKEIL